MSLPKKVKTIAFLVFFLFLFLNSYRSIFAYYDPGTGGGGAGGGFYSESYSKFEDTLKKDRDEKTVSHDSFWASSVNAFLNSGIFQAAGHTCKEGDTECIRQLQTYGSGGALGGLASLISTLCSIPPASGVEYLADLGKNFGITKPAYAQQGIGFKSFAPILEIWKIFRNLAYLAFVLIFIITGLAIMFRVKISPQAVITIESALPKIVVALIMVTFSYAIAGFLIDLIYVLIGIMVAIFKNNLPTYMVNDDFYNLSLGTLIKDYVINGAKFGWDLTSVLRIEIELPILGKIPILGTGIASGLLTLILILAALFALFKLFFALLMSYIQIILGIIISPLVIMASAFPGKEGNSLGWIKSLLSNILVFPAVVGFFLLGGVIHKMTLGNEENIWTPPYLFPVDAKVIGALICYGLLMLAPKVPEYVKALFEPKAKITPPGAAFLGGVAGGLGIADVGYGKLIGEKAGIAEEAWRRAGGKETEYKAAMPSWMRHIPKSLSGRR